ncbi:hypothetical protein [Aestuariicoccus sp. MJ-SS9]|uniref:hypothetical protein n=1 Tax=Aestuariicoccus sp. MJ-SS9 TaxID=3079855 RepID=UPI002909A4FB|nr:hypothetical protein [Aestuariicoccus sp. MJ-SS9]MDU8913732.1 hypothetical protein [Aestuariicoccus sp. MJ-SS9]
MSDDPDAGDPRPPLFLERQSYRRRRLRDAARALPVLGMLLWLVPVIWPTGPGTGQGTGVTSSSALIYIFGVWALLAGAAALLSLRLRSEEGERRG